MAQVPARQVQVVYHVTLPADSPAAPAPFSTPSDPTPLHPTPPHTDGGGDADTTSIGR